METLTLSLKENLLARLKSYDMVLARIPQFAQQQGIVDLGKVYRTRFLFTDRYFSIGVKQINFVGGGGAFGDISNCRGEIGFLFLNNRNDRVYQCHWQGHIPIERHDGELWCVLYNVRLWLKMEAPQVIMDNYKPSPHRLDKDGNALDSLVRFEVLEAYLMELIAELDQKPCEPFEVVDMQNWRVFKKVL
jgi:hypothetical protein